MLGERLRTLLNERNLTVNEFAEMCGLPVETIRNIYYGKSTDPKLSTAFKIADALNLNVNCLMGKCPHTSAERALIHNYRRCGKHGKSVIELSARYEASAIKNEREGIDRHKIPCIMPRGEIRKGIVYDLCETVEIETTIKDAFIAIQMTNNDLAPMYCKNDIIMFEDRIPENGEMSAFFKGDRVYIRKFIEEAGQYRLKCIHKQGEDIILKRLSEIDYIGTVIDVVRE